MARSEHYFQHLRRSQRTRKTVDRFTYAVAVLGNAAVVPQAIEAWKSSAPGMSILTWALFVGVSFIWLIYALIHQAKPLIVGQVIVLACDLAVVSGWAFHHWF